jgi:hypothetical protein
MYMKIKADIISPAPDLPKVQTVVAYSAKPLEIRFQSFTDLVIFRFGNFRRDSWRRGKWA